MLTTNNTWKDIEDSGTAIAILPIGATEQHGTNLPLCTDTLLTTKVAEAIAEALGAYLVPTLPIGTSATHLSFPGTLTLQHETLKAVIADVVDSLVQTSFKTIVIVSMHYGNYVVWSDFIPELNARYPGVRLLVMQPRRAWEEASKAAGITTPGLHCDESEASLIACLRPELVGPCPTDCPDFRARMKGVRRTQTGFPVDVREVSPSGALGEPSRGSKEKGEKFWQTFLAIVVEDIKKELAS